MGLRSHLALVLVADAKYIDSSTVVICQGRVSMLPLGHAESIDQAKGVYDGTADCGTCAGGY